MDTDAFDPDVLPIPDLGLTCPKCRFSLAGLPEHRCSECGWRFEMDDLVPPGDFPTLIFRGKEVLLTPVVMELLRRGQIPFMDSLGVTDALYGLGGATHLRARAGVPRTLYLQALELLKHYDQTGEMPEPSPKTNAQPWTCPKCGESNPATFDVCWKCNSGGDETEE